MRMHKHEKALELAKYKREKRVAFQFLRTFAKNKWTDNMNRIDEKIIFESTGFGYQNTKAKVVILEPCLFRRV